MSATVRSLFEQAQQLSHAERTLLIELLLDTDSHSAPSLTEAQLAELDQRLADHVAGRSSSFTWQEVQDYARAAHNQPPASR